MAVAGAGGVSLEKGVFIDTALPSRPWAFLGSYHVSPLLQTRIAASLPRRLSLQRLLNTTAITTWDSGPGWMLGSFWSPPMSQGPFDGFHVMSSYPIQDFSFKRKN